MPQLNGQGISEQTPYKLDAFSRILHQNIGIVSKKYRDATYIHIDLHAGSGTNVVDGVEYSGSPLLLVEAMRHWKRPVTAAMFVDRDRSACIALGRRLPVANSPDSPDLKIYNYDNAEFLTGIPVTLGRLGIRKYTFGSILCDPNGADVPFDALRVFSERFPRVDIILAVSVTAMNRARTSKPDGRFGDKYLADIPAFLNNKSDWNIAPPDPADKWRRVILVGRNYRYSPVGKFYQWGSEAADRVLAEYNLTKNERLIAQKKTTLLQFPTERTESTSLRQVSERFAGKS